MVSLTAALLAVGLHWAREREVIRLRATSELAAIADLKLRQVMAWREERLSDGRFFSRAPFVASDIEALLANPSAEPTRTQVLQWLALLQGGDRYAQIAIYRPDRTELLSTNHSASYAPPPAAEIDTALQGRDAILTDLHRDANGLHLNVLVPVFPSRTGSTPEAKPIAAIILRLDPQRFLYPLLQQWPLPSQTSETALARQEGTDVLFLNEMRHRPSTALNLRLPIAADHPIALAIRGTPGVHEARDYRGQRVVAVVYPIPDSPWWLEVKMDRDEVFAPLRLQLMNAGAVALALTLATLGGAAWFWRRQEAALLRRELTHETALVEAEAKYRSYVNASPLGIFVVDPQGRFTEVNPAVTEICGYEPSETIGTPFLDFLLPAEAAAGQAALQRTFDHGGASGSIGIRHKHEYEVVVEFNAVKLSPERALCFCRDVTAEREVEKSLQLFRALVDRSSDSIEVIDPATGRILDINERACIDLGYSRAELLALHVHDIDPTITPENWPRRLAGARESGSGTFETMHRHKDGTLFPVEVNVRYVRLDRDYLIAAVRDISERKLAEDQLRRLSAAVEQNPVSIMITDARGHIEYVNPAFTKLTGYGADDVRGKTPRILKSGHHPLEFYQQMWKELTAGRIWRGELHNRKRDGELYWEWATIAPILDAQGRTTEFVSIKEDITDRKRAADALRESQERFSELAENIGEVFWVVEPRDGRFSYISPAYERIWGRTAESLYRDSDAWIDAIHPEDRERVGQHLRERSAGTFDQTYRIVRPDDSIRWIRDRAFPVRSGSGKIVRIVGVAQDITESRRLEAQYLQAQKMEAIGQLAGGVAHDFNNVLSVITVHSDLLSSSVAADDPILESVQDIQRAAERAASLTRQLLVFSRQQVVEPKVLDLNAQVTDSEKMLRRLIGEDVRLHTALAPNLPAVRIDPGHFGQVIMNLAVNARDAMPQGGQLTIETKAVEIDENHRKIHTEAQLGHYVLLTMADTGTGMPPEVQARIFEPFFTTKGVGRGTGLGLAVVHGIIKQAGGYLNVYSEMGRGTTFRIYLPAIEEEPRASSSYVKAQAARGTETILVVDDEEAFRRVTAVALEHLGYTVLPANGGPQALEIVDGYDGQIHLLLTDVVMPVMGGRQLAEALRLRFPTIKVLFQSGYTDDAVVRHGVLQAEVAFLQKPFTMAGLAAKVREVLDTPPQGSEK